MSHLRALTSWEVRVFLTPACYKNMQLGSGRCCYLFSEQRAYLANEPNSPQGPCLSHCNGTRSKSHSVGSCSCVCSRAHFRRTFEILISWSSCGVLLSHIMDVSMLHTFFPLKMGLEEGRRTPHVRAKPFVWHEANLLPPVILIGNNGVTCMKGVDIPRRA